MLYTMHVMRLLACVRSTPIFNCANGLGLVDGRMFSDNAPSVLLRLLITTCRGPALTVTCEETELPAQLSEDMKKIRRPYTPKIVTKVTKRRLLGTKCAKHADNDRQLVIIGKCPEFPIRLVLEVSNGVIRKEDIIVNHPIGGQFACLIPIDTKDHSHFTMVVNIEARALLPDPIAGLGMLSRMERTNRLCDLAAIEQMG
mmetsp:Transcript_28754/g.57355  ORF Transcript_28754/g.57355 Transcript_28754/m.57355 type:complete len:200 (+) Transcript_28754:1418-2017(+)